MRMPLCNRNVAFFCIDFEVLQVDIDTVDGAVVQALGRGLSRARSSVWGGGCLESHVPRFQCLRYGKP